MAGKKYRQKEQTRAALDRSIDPDGSLTEMRASGSASELVRQVDCIAIDRAKPFSNATRRSLLNAC